MSGGGGGKPGDWGTRSKLKTFSAEQDLAYMYRNQKVIVDKIGKQEFENLVQKLKTFIRVTRG
jgi:hypothetical protein